MVTIPSGQRKITEAEEVYMRQFAYPEFKGKEKILVTTDGDFSGMLQDIRVYRLVSGDEMKFIIEDMEQAVLLVKGEVDFLWNQEIRHARRESFIEGGPFCIHTCAGTAVSVKVYTDTEILVQRTKNGKIFEPVYYTPEACVDANACQNLFEGKAHRSVRTIFDYKNAPYSNMVLGEIVTKQGGWCSYIPHSHEQPEVYYYRHERPEGFGACFIGDNAYKVKDGSFAAITPGETHPQVTAPGYPQYCVWMIRHLEGNPWIDRADDPAYEWLLSEKITYR